MSTTGALSGKVALVTGAGSAGIGRAICSRLAGHGAAIAAFDLDHAGLDATASALATRLHLEAVDIAQAELVDAAVDRAVAALGEIDILINCAGVVDKAKAIVDTSDEDWDRVFAVNVRAPFRLIRKVAPGMMRKRSGRIVNITSSSAHRARQSLPAYGASKSALMQFTRSAAAELGPYDINVNAIAPGLTRTPMLGAAFDEEAVNALIREGPLANLLGRVSLPDDIAEVALFLCLPASRQITAQTIHVSAGAVV